MKKIPGFLLITFFFVFNNELQSLYAQKQIIDSLLNCLEKAPDDTFKVETLNRLSSAYLKVNIERAKEFALNSLHYAKKINYKKGIVDSYKHLGAANMYRGNYDEAIKSYLDSYKMAKESNNMEEIANGLSNIGNIYYYKGNYEKAIEYYQKSLKIKECCANDADVSRNLLYIGAVYEVQSNYARAIEYFQKALKIMERHNDQMSVSICLNNIGTVYQFQANYPEAIRYYLEALKISKKHGDKKGMATRLNNIGEIFYCQNKYTKAMEYLHKSLRISEEIGYRASSSLSLNNIGKTYTEEGYFDKAFEFYQKSLKLSNEIGSKISTIESINLLGKLFLKQQEYRRTLKYFQDALIANVPGFIDSIIYKNPKKLNALSKSNLLETLNLKAKTFFLLYCQKSLVNDIETSLGTYDLAFKLINELRNDYSHESTQLLLSENMKDYFVDALNAAITCNHIKSSQKSNEKVFEYLEKSKGSAQNAYFNNLHLMQQANISDSILEKEKDIAINRRFYETAIQKAKAQKDGYDTLLVHDYQDKLFNYSRKYDSLIDIFKNEYPDYYKLKYEQNVASIEGVQNQLDKSSALINYFVADTSLFIAVVNKDSLVYKVTQV